MKTAPEAASAVVEAEEMGEVGEDGEVGGVGGSGGIEGVGEIGAVGGLERVDGVGEGGAMGAVGGAPAATHEAAVEADGPTTTAPEGGPAARAGVATAALEELVATPMVELPPAAAIRTARVVKVKGRQAQIELRGMHVPIDATVAPEVDPEVIADALEGGDTVLVETAPGAVPVVVGVLHTRRPRELKLRAGSVQIEGDEEVLLRAGQAAIRIRADGDVEVVGSRISAASRGLFRIVGRLLRLN